MLPQLHCIAMAASGITRSQEWPHVSSPSGAPSAEISNQSDQGPQPASIKIVMYVDHDERSGSEPDIRPG